MLSGRPKPSAAPIVAISRSKAAQPKPTIVESSADLPIFIASPHSTAAGSCARIDELIGQAYADQRAQHGV